MSGFHDGELAVQRQAGVEAAAARLSSMLSRAELRDGTAAFLHDATFAAITARDPAGHLWISPLSGPPGFLNRAGPRTLTIRPRFPEQAPLHGLPVDQPIGLVVVEFAAKRRVRVNGTLTDVHNGELVVDVEQAYGNCPQYIRQRHLTTESVGAGQARVSRRRTLAAEDVSLIQSADTFFLGTTHPERGNDASHRGGPPGFVRTDGETLWWPDYPGNNMFNSFGNLAADPTAALLFVDFRTGHTLHLSGTATVQWNIPGDPDDDTRTGRGVHFTPTRVAAGRLLPAREIGRD